MMAEAKMREERRAQAVIDAVRCEHEIDDMRDDSIWLEMRHLELLKLGAMALDMSNDDRCLWRWHFCNSNKTDRRFFA